MKKCETIANCLVNSGFCKEIETAELSVRKIFESEFPEENFAKWNSSLSHAASQGIINGVGRASRINVRKFIQDLWSA